MKTLYNQDTETRTDVWRPSGRPPYEPPPGPPVWGETPVGPPTGPPTAPPPVRPQSATSPSSWGLALIVAVVTAVLVATVAVGFGATKLFTTETSAPTASGPIAIAPSTSVPSTTVPSTTPSTSLGSGTGKSSQTNWIQVASVVSAGVVNIESQLPEGVGAGTGMVLSASGEILTNNHVVDGASRVVATVATTGATYSAKIVGTDPANDVAVLELSGASDLTTIPLGDSDTVKTGDPIAAIGNAGGQGGEPSVATGTVVGLNRQITASNQDGSNAETLTDMIQVNANVVPGDSGGPLASAEGKVIGINTAASSGAGTGRGRFRTSASEGYAIPINRALTVAQKLEAGGGSSSSGSSNGSAGSSSTGRGFLGVQVQGGSSGASVVGVQSGSPAAQAGIKAGDVITSVGGQRVSSASDLVSALQSHKPGEQVTVTWQTSSGRQQQATITLASQ